MALLRPIEHGIFLIPVSRGYLKPAKPTSQKSGCSIIRDLSKPTTQVVDSTALDRLNRLDYFEGSWQICNPKGCCQFFGRGLLLWKDPPIKNKSPGGHHPDGRRRSPLRKPGSTAKHWNITPSWLTSSLSLAQERHDSARC